MNKENILKVADAIEQHSIPDLGFNMAEWFGPADDEGQPDRSGHNCGTVACVAGWACAVLAGDVEKVWDYGYPQLGDLLGIGVDDAVALFVPSRAGAILHAIPQAQAVRTLRHLAATGEVDWSVAP